METEMKRLMLLSSALVLSASMSFAAVTANDLVTSYQAQGFTRIEVKTGLTQIKVEAVKGTTKLEVIYDAATGAILKQESERARRSDRGTGVELSTENRDFLDGSDDDWDDDDHSSNYDHDDDHSSNDDHDDDHSGNDDDDDDDHSGNDDDDDDDDGRGRGRGRGRGGDDN
jgi:hypothetical protein